MKVGCIGTGGTGKTTTLKLVENYVPENYIPGVMRDVFKDLNVPTEASQHHMSSNDRWRLQKTGFDRKVQQDQDHQDGLFDRTLLDHFIYCLLWSREKVTDSVCKSMMILAQENLAKYDLLFYFPLYDWPTNPDGMREDSFAARLTWDYIAKGFLKEAKICPTKVPDGDPQTRAQFVLDAINQAKEGGRDSGREQRRG